MNALVKTESTALAAMSEIELGKVLQTSLYPGAAMESIKMVLGYCKAAGLDPMQKPVHIVPTWDSKTKQMRDVIMPGVGLYRTQASRTGRFAGQSEPEFGPMVTDTLSGQKITYPEWARVTVKKQMDNGSVAEFTAKEYWIENYAVKGGQDKSVAPNAMWAKRPRGQIGKCAAAQALRLAFPEMGAQSTAEEMEGKPMHPDESVQLLIQEPPAALVAAASEAAAAGMASYQKFWQASGADSRKLLAGEHDRLKDLAAAADKARTIETPAKTAPVPKTFDEVMAMICAAKTEDALFVAADLINAITDGQDVLNEKFDEVLATLRGAQ